MVVICTILIASNELLVLWELFFLVCDFSGVLKVFLLLLLILLLLLLLFSKIKKILDSTKYAKTDEFYINSVIRSGVSTKKSFKMVNKTRLNSAIYEYCKNVCELFYCVYNIYIYCYYWDRGDKLSVCQMCNIYSSCIILKKKREGDSIIWFKKFKMDYFISLQTFLESNRFRTKKFFSIISWYYSYSC